MLVNLVPEFLAVLAAPDPTAAYHEYLERHKPVLHGYWHNYVLDPTSPHAEQVIAAALRADRSDLYGLLEDVDVAAIADEALGRSLEQFEADCPVDLYLMVGVGAANAGELVVGGRGIAFVCLEHFTGRANPQTYGMGLAPHLLPLWIAHEVARAGGRPRCPPPPPRAAPTCGAWWRTCAGITTIGTPGAGRACASCSRTRVWRWPGLRRCHRGAIRGSILSLRGTNTGGSASSTPSCGARPRPSSRNRGWGCGCVFYRAA